MKNYFISKEQFESNNFANVVFHYEDCDFETMVALKPMEQLGITENDDDDEKNDGTPFTSEVIGIDVPVWDEKAK